MSGAYNWFNLQERSNLFQTLQGDKDLNRQKKLSAEAQKELALVERNLLDTPLYQIKPKMACILVILPSTYSPTGILLQREDYILEWIFLAHKQSKKLKTTLRRSLN